ncbi:CHC2 zinc finger domain-containing protein [Jeotgalibacillus sp. ET6]|uniref:CHC2 zinc finger domain-containing protein n=1 Tax=Jeotgalibacillus sp. ET6 TaxID=3037260 RepID=UPI002418841E|nr:CHC2 zinc finger domain-containing protein [Jeotgalibacillus sp. ET6]MDG5473912.1 CHC2 zinc finger domain-containing protein [Jeotgalibacillus sp. ET6]
MNENNILHRFISLFRKENEEIIVPLIKENPGAKSFFNNNRTVFHPSTISNDFQNDLNKIVLKERMNNCEFKFFPKHYNENGYGVFFIPNIGGKTNSNIKEVRSWFCDIDYGKIKEKFETEQEMEKRKKELEETGNFLFIDPSKKENIKGTFYFLTGVYKQDFISKKKTAFLEDHKNDLKKSSIAETYSGFHIYFLCESGSLENFKKVQESLSFKFGGDPQVKNESRMMRLPEFDHNKYDDPFSVKVIQWSEHRYTESELLKELNITFSNQQKGFKKRQRIEKVSYMSGVVTSFVEKTKKTDSDLEFISFKKPSKEMTFKETIEEILSLPISNFVKSPEMELGNKIHCPFHEDHNPSATIFESDSGQELFHCHSCVDLNSMNIIKLYQLHTNKSYRKSITDLSKMVGIKVIKTVFEESQFEKYRDNRDFIDEIESLPYASSYLLKYSRSLLLRLFNDQGESKVVHEDFQFEGHNIFFASMRHLSREFGLGKKSVPLQTIQNNLFLFQLLGLIKRVPPKNIPERLLKRSEKEMDIRKSELQKQGTEGKIKSLGYRMINYYIVTNWQDDFMEIESAARKLKEINFSFKNHRNKFSIESIFGKKIANEIFPDERKLPGRFVTISNLLEKEIEQNINKKGFAVKEEIIRKTIRVKSEGKYVKATLKEKEDVFRRVFSGYNKFSIKQVRSSNKKRELGLIDDGKTVSVIYPAKKE